MIKNCPSCKKNLKETGIGYSQTGDMTYDLDLDSQGDLMWEQDEFYSNDSGTFYCKDCSNDLDLTEEEVIKILK